MGSEQLLAQLLNTNMHIFLAHSFGEQIQPEHVPLVTCSWTNQSEGWSCEGSCKLVPYYKYS